MSPSRTRCETVRTGVVVSAAVLFEIACRSPAPDDRESSASTANVEAVAPAKEPKDPATTPARERPTENTSTTPSSVRPDGTVYAETAQMGTRVSINVWLAPGQDAKAAQQAMQDAFMEIERLEDIMSEWRPHSELSRLNDAASRPMSAPIPVSPELFDVLSRARQISRRTGGAFDVTFHGVGQLWTFSPGAKPPDREEIARHLPLVDWKAMELDAQRSTVRMGRAGMKIGLGAIGKGYAVDRASALLRQRGFTHHIVEGGGDTYVSGSKQGNPWKVGVQAPDRAGTVGILPSRDEAIVTSGDYQRYFEHEGKRYSHIIDPRTGWPLARSDAPRSVTMVASNATDADAYCTAVAVMGVERGLAFVEEVPELEAIFIEQDGDILVSSGLQGRYIPTPASHATSALPP